MKSRPSRISQVPYGDDFKISAERRHISHRPSFISMLRKAKWPIAAGVAVIMIGCAGYLIASEIRDRHHHQAAAGSAIREGGVREEVVRHLEKIKSDLVLHGYGIRTANHLQQLLENGALREPPFDAWKSLLREVACLNYRYGATGVGLYLELRDATFNTDDRQAFFARSQREIVRNGDRHVLSEVQEDLEACR